MKIARIVLARAATALLLTALLLPGLLAAQGDLVAVDHGAAAALTSAVLDADHHGLASPLAEASSKKAEGEDEAPSPSATPTNWPEPGCSLTRLGDAARHLVRAPRVRHVFCLGPRSPPPLA